MHRIRDLGTPDFKWDVCVISLPSRFRDLGKKERFKELEVRNGYKETLFLKNKKEDTC